MCEKPTVEKEVWNLFGPECTREVYATVKGNITEYFTLSNKRIYTKINKKNIKNVI